MTALSTQLCYAKIIGIRFDWRSALITGFSLALLLRVDQLYFVVIAAVLAISSKFLIRIADRHIFNPANFAIVVLLLSGADVWVSPGQWGNGLLLAFLLCVLGLTVLTQTRQWDIAFSFLLMFGGLVFGRAIYLGDELSIPLHQLSSSALLIFAFFMISDPKTIPVTRLGRFIFSAVVAAVAFYLRFYHYNNEAIFYALFCVCFIYSIFVAGQQWQGAGVTIKEESNYAA